MNNIIEDNYWFEQLKVEENNFEKSFFYFFGLTDNPFKKAVKEIYLKNLNEAIGQDWAVVLNDLNKVFKKEAESLNVEE
ncbi:MAG: hypothetical protein N2044_05900 [Cyclobacteriaceae bacterium]|nr:hypothetical protein [Cyclobacteriaceae bacterium]MCX7637364.1 hypothetical protein [Cyclobacteriaceae bacterium]MDW8330064.1 hypothetical protein [Cyclobacteriaceae bacterium]